MKSLTPNFIALILLMVSCNSPNYYEEGKTLYESGDFKNAVDKLKNVKTEEENYSVALELISTADSIIKIIEREQFVIDSIVNVKEQARLDSIKIVEVKIKEEKEIGRLGKELKSIKTFDGSTYRGDVTTLTIEVALFSTWANMAEEAKSNKNRTIQKLGRDILKYLKRLQVKEFPKIRADYAKFLKKMLWEENIVVSNYGTGKSTLQFTGGIFASNKNKKEFQSTLHQTLTDFRFKRTNYKWYKGADEYTYYKIESEKDSEIKTY